VASKQFNHSQASARGIQPHADFEPRRLGSGVAPHPQSETRGQGRPQPPTPRTQKGPAGRAVSGAKISSAVNRGRAGIEIRIRGGFGDIFLARAINRPFIPCQGRAQPHTGTIQFSLSMNEDRHRRTPDHQQGHPQHPSPPTGEGVAHGDLPGPKAAWPIPNGVSAKPKHARFPRGHPSASNRYPTFISTRPKLHAFLIDTHDQNKS